MDRQHSSLTRNRLVKSCLMVAVCISMCGCAGVLSNLMYMVHGLEVEAVYDGLEDSRVAVVVVSNESSFGPDELSSIVGRAMSMRLAINVKKITVIPQNVVDNWKDLHGSDQVDFLALGKGVEADRVLAIKIDSYSIREGATLLKGRSMLTTTVYDIADGGKVVFSDGPAEYAFPRSHARPIMGTTEQQFEAVYLAKLVNSIARNFYDHDKAEPVAEDATGIGFQ